MRFLTWGLWGALLSAALFAAAACSNGTASVAEREKAENDKAEKAEDTKVAAKEKSTKTPVVPVEQSARKNLEGRWMLVISQPPPSGGLYDFYTVLLEFSKAEAPSAESGEYTAKVLDRSELFPYEITLKSSRASKDSVEFVLGVDQGEASFEGRLSDGVVRGNVEFGPSLSPQPARLVATSEKTAESFKEPKIPDGVEQLQKAVVGDDKFEAVLAFATKNPTSPLAPFVLQQLAGLLAEEEMAAAAVQGFVKSAEGVAKVWGPRMERSVKLSVATQLASDRHLPELALKYLDEAEAGMSPERKSELEPLLGALRHQALTAKARDMIFDGEGEAGFQLAKELRQKNPFDPTLTWLVGSHLKKNGQTDEAIPLYAELSALPLMQAAVVQDAAYQARETESPGETLSKLWTEKHGDTKELPEYLDSVYREKVAELTEQTKKDVPAADPAGNRVVVAELFTGAGCGPCVAADLASAALEETYEPSDVVVLRYHQHVGAPDPLATEQTLKRFEFYGLDSTPSMLVSGRPVPAVGGFLTEVSRSYREIRETVDPLLAEETPVRLTLKAQAKDGELSVDVDASGIEGDTDDLRLAVVLAEESVEMNAPNGIRHHEMIVRTLFGEPLGIEPKDGQLGFHEKVKLDDLKQELIDGLSEIEKQVGGSIPEKPLAMKDLRLVAFVQNAQTKEVLQAASAAVTGEVTYTVDIAPPPPKDQKVEVPKDESAGQTKDGPRFVLPDLPIDK